MFMIVSDIWTSPPLLNKKNTHQLFPSSVLATAFGPQAWSAAALSQKPQNQPVVTSNLNIIGVHCLTQSFILFLKSLVIK